jgi:type VI secretion system secreted protein VgrG
MRILIIAALVSSSLNVYASLIDVNLGTAGTFAVLAGSTATNTGPTTLNGNLGVSPGTAITGFPPGAVTTPFAQYAGGPVAAQAESDLATAYLYAAGQPCGDTLTGQNLGGITLTPGVYCFGSTAQLSGTLTLNAEGFQDPTFLFQIGSTLTTATNSAVVFINNAEGASAFWQVGTSATLGTGTQFEGNILASASITLDSGATIQCGSALAETAAVTLDSNTVSLDTGVCESGTGAGSTASPEPSPGILILLAVASLLLWRRSHTSQSIV